MSPYNCRRLTAHILSSDWVVISVALLFMHRPKTTTGRLILARGAQPAVLNYQHFRPFGIGTAIAMAK